MFLIFTGAAAYAGEIELKPTASVCESSLAGVKHALELVSEDLLIGYKKVLHVGSFYDLKQVALESGMKRQTVVQAIAVVDRMLRQNRHQDSVLGTTYRYLRKYERDADTLMVCVAADSCQMVVGTLFVPDESSLALSNLERVRVRPPLGGRIPNLLMYNGGTTPFVVQGIVAPSSVEALGWAVDILTSASSFAAFRLIQDWIAANRALAQMGEPTDELFDRYVRTVPEVKLDTGFFRVLESGRAGVITAALAPDHAASVREHTMAEMDLSSDETKSVVTHFHLRPGNIFEFADRVTDDMASTVRRATKH